MCIRDRVDSKTGFCSFNPSHNVGKRLAESLNYHPNTIIQHDKQDKSHFHFKLTDRGNGYYSVQSNYRIQKGDNYVWTIKDGKLKTAPYQTGNQNQLFKFESLVPNLENEASYFIQVKSNSKYIDVPASSTEEGADMIVWGKTGNKNQKFKLRFDANTGYSSFAPAHNTCLLYTSPSPRDRTRSRMPSSA